MANFEVFDRVIERRSKNILDGCVAGISKNQDRIYYGKTDDMEWSVLLDGHGTNCFIELFSNYNWEETFKAEEPWEVLEKYLIKIKHTYGYSSSGSTLLLMRAFSNRIETWSIGDSHILIHKNGEQVYVNTSHNLKNPLEQERLKDTPIRVQKMKHPVFQIRSSTTLQARETEYVFFDSNTQLAMTQSIGHNNITGYSPERNIVYFEPEDEIQCILGSDGFFDMILLSSFVPNNPPLTEEEVLMIQKDTEDLIKMDAKNLVEKAVQRWKQEWTYMWNVDDFSDSYVSKLPDYDDVGVILWRKN